MGNRLGYFDKNGKKLHDLGLDAEDVHRLQKQAGKALTNRIIAAGKKEKGEYVSKSYLMEYRSSMHRELELSVGERYVWYIVKALIRSKNEFVYLSPTKVATCINLLFDKKYTKNNISKYIGGLWGSNFICGVEGHRGLYMFNPDICHCEKQHILWTRYQHYDVFKEKGLRHYTLSEDILKYIKIELGQTPQDIKDDCMEYAERVLTVNLPRRLRRFNQKIKESNEYGESDEVQDLSEYSDME